MAIENRNLEAGTVLAGRYLGTRYECVVLESEGVFVAVGVEVTGGRGVTENE